MVNRHKRHIKNFFINKNFQGKIALAIFLTVVVGCLIFLLLLALFSSDTTTISYSNNDIQVENTVWLLLKNALAANWIFLIIGSGVLTVLTMIGTHRIAGPIFRFEKALDNMAKGKISETITLRETDEGQLLAEKINYFNSVLSGKIHEINRNAEAVNNLLVQFDNLDATRISAEDATSICKAIKRHNDGIRAQVKFFTFKKQ
jgi:methyl-accepting chemotaxis protein